MSDARPVVVVGGGLAGLTAALVLARERVPVVCLEGAGEPGGRARSSDVEGFRLNLGPHALHAAGAGTRLLRRMSIDLPGGAPPARRTRLLVDGRVLSPLTRRAGGPGVRAGVAAARLAADARRGEPEGSVADWLDRRAPDARTRVALGALARLTTYADAFDEQAADLMAEALRGGTVRYLDGGWGALVGRLRRAAVQAGAELRTGSPVRSVERLGDGRFDVEVADGSHLEARAVVLAAGGPDAAARLVDDPAAARLRAAAARARPVRMACLDLALARRPAMPSLVLGAEEPVYLSVQSDAAAVSAGHGAVVHLARFQPLDGAAPADTRARLEALLDQVAAGWLNRTTSRICLDRLRSAHRRREAYVGPWLPEPLATEPDAGATVELAESVSMAFLVVLETLGPDERVAFVLHEVFGHTHGEIAEVLGCTQVASRQLVSRARRRVHARRPRFETDPDARATVVATFLDACRTGEVDAVVEMLAPEVVLRSDGGGQVSAAQHPIVGAGRVARFLLGVAAQAPAGTRLQQPALNGAPGLLVWRPDGALDTAMLLDVADGRVHAVSVVRNPDKLAHLTAAADRARRHGSQLIEL